MGSKIALIFLFLVLVFKTFSVRSDDSLVLDFKVPVNNSEFSQAIAEVIRSFYNKVTSTVHIVRSSIDSKSYQVQGALVNEILQKSKGIDVAFFLEGYIHLHVGLRRFHSIFIVDGYQSFRFLKFRMNAENFNYRGFYLIVYTGNSRNYFPVITKIFQELFHMYITNVNIIINVNGKILVYTYFPFTRFHCNAAVPVLYNRFMNGKFLIEKDIFPKKTYNMHQCPVTVTTWNSAPYMFIKNRGNDSFSFSGIDGLVLQMLSERLNFKLVLKPPPADVVRGTLYPNGTATGAFKMVMDGEANMTLNDFGFILMRKKYLSASYGYRSSSLSMAVPPGAEYSPLEKLALPFKYIIWSCVASSLILGCLAIIFLSIKRDKTFAHFVFGRENKTPLLNLVNIFLGGSLNVLPSRNFARTILMIWTLYTFILRNAYQGALFKFLQTSMAKKPLEELDMLMQMNFTIYGEVSAKQVVSFGEYLTPMTAHYNEYLKLLHDPNSKSAVLCTEPLIVYYNAQNYNKGLIYRLPARFFLISIVIYLRKYSYFKEPIDHELQLFAENGMISHFHNIYLGGRTSSDDTSINEPHIIRIENFAGILEVCSLLIFVSILMFFLEVLSTRLKLLKRAMDFLNDYLN